jgi:hypothetical protein
MSLEFVPRTRRREDDGPAVDQGVLVVSGGRPTPLLEQGEGAFNDVASLGELPVVGDRSAALAAAAGVVGLLVADHVAGKGLDPMMLGLVACN